MDFGGEARVARRSVKQEVNSSRAWLRALESSAKATRDHERILPRFVADWARDYVDATALISDIERISFRDLEQRMNQYSRWALSEDVQLGQVIALIMGNSPEYFLIWLGLIQVGAIVALIGPDLPPPALAHALRVAGARRLIASAECAEVCRRAVAELVEPAKIWI